MRRLLLLGVLAVVGAGIAVAARPGAAALVLQLLIIGLAATLAVALVARLASAYSFLPRSPRPRPRPERVTSTPNRELSRLRRQVELGTTSGEDFERFLRPVLVDVAMDLLRFRGVELGEEPLRARRMLGEETWRILGVSEPEGDPRAPSPAALQHAIEGLERL